MIARSSVPRRDVEVPQGYVLVSQVHLGTVLSLARTALANFESTPLAYEEDRPAHRERYRKLAFAVDHVYRTPADVEADRIAFERRKKESEWDGIAAAMTLAYERGRQA